MQECMNDLSLQDRIAKVAEDRFAWPGGYALGLLMKDGECVCSACVLENQGLILDATLNDCDDQWCAVAAYYVDADDDGYGEGEDATPATLCAHCNRPISDATTQKK